MPISTAEIRRRRELSPPDFRGVDLRGVNLRFAKLPNADFRDADLRGTDFSAADLSGAIFCGARFGPSGLWALAYWAVLVLAVLWAGLSMRLLAIAIAYAYHPVLQPQLGGIGAIIGAIAGAVTLTRPEPDEAALKGLGIVWLGTLLTGSIEANVRAGAPGASAMMPFVVLVGAISGVWTLALVIAASASFAFSLAELLGGYRLVAASVLVMLFTNLDRAATDRLARMMFGGSSRIALGVMLLAVLTIAIVLTSLYVMHLTLTRDMRFFGWFETVDPTIAFKATCFEGARLIGADLRQTCIQGANRFRAEGGTTE